MAIAAAIQSESLPSSPATDESGANAQNPDVLFASLYRELRRLAQRQLKGSAANVLSPTTLLHETYLNLARRESLQFTGGAQFLCYASRAMRGLLICHLRNRRARKRGGEVQLLPLQTDLINAASDNDFESQSLERLNDALESLAQVAPRLAECVDLRFFCGLSFDEISQLRGVSERTVQRDWDKARVLLNRLLNNHSLEEPADP